MTVVVYTTTRASERNIAPPSSACESAFGAQQFSRIGNREAHCFPEIPGRLPRRGSMFADICQEIRCGVYRRRPLVA
jgi:hypothetical protein